MVAHLTHVNAVIIQYGVQNQNWCSQYFKTPSKIYLPDTLSGT